MQIKYKNKTYLHIEKILLIETASKKNSDKNNFSMNFKSSQSVSQSLELFLVVLWHNGITTYAI